MIIAGTGHRPPRLGLDYSLRSREKLRKFLIQQMEKSGYLFIKVISGMAQGFDTAVAEAALELKIPLTCAIPFSGQESKWPVEAQKLYHDILNQAIEVVNVCGGSYANWKFFERDKWMVNELHTKENSRLFALLDDKQEKSGTRHTVEYAKSRNIKIENLWTEWKLLGVS